MNFADVNKLRFFKTANPEFAHKFLKIIILFLLAYAYLSHLGYLPLDPESDEARRAVVTAEMMISKNYITPTINGEIYINKPPLYNWIVAGYFKIFGDYSMFAFRLQMIIAIFLTGLMIYFFNKKFTNKNLAFFTAVAYMANGRILLYDSLFGFIDTTFTLFVYSGMMLIFYFGEKKRYYSLFITSYIACTLAFFLKGLPALVFQALTLLTYFIYKKEFKKLFSLAHIAGIGVALIILFSYYFTYFSQNHFSYTILFQNLINESSQKSYGGDGFLDNIHNFFVFPFHVLYHFLPWTVFVIALFRKNIFSIIKKNSFIFYTTLIFLVNIPIYWLSADIYPKYVFMFIPLLYNVLFYCFFEMDFHKKTVQEKMIYGVFYFLCAAMFAIALIIMFLDPHTTATHPYIKNILLILMTGFGTFMAIRSRQKVYFILIVFIAVRIGFNWFVMIKRGEHSFILRQDAQKISSITSGKKLFILKGAKTDNFDGMSFYLATKRNDILKKAGAPEHNTYYIVDEDQLKQKPFIMQLHFINYPFNNSLYLVYMP